MGITVPREYGGAEVSNVTLAEVIAIVSQADPSLGQIPQNHYCLIEDIRLEGSDAQKRFFFDLVLKGTRYGNAFSEAGGKNVLDIQTRVRRDGDAFVLNGRKFYSTGTLFAHWIPVLALDESDQAVLAFVRQGAPGLTVVDDWSGFGQRTTASGTVIVENVRVAVRNFPHAAFVRPPDLRGRSRRSRPPRSTSVLRAPRWRTRSRSCSSMRARGSTAASKARARIR